MATTLSTVHLTEADLAAKTVIAKTCGAKSMFTARHKLLPRQRQQCKLLNPSHSTLLAYPTVDDESLGPWILVHNGSSGVHVSMDATTSTSLTNWFMSMSGSAKLAA